MKKIFSPFEKLSKSTKTSILCFWILFILTFWIMATAGQKHLFPSPNQVFDGFLSLFNEGLVEHIFSSLKLCFTSIFIAIIVSMFFSIFKTRV
jgi:ABC-type nitrate/sulfonate/bicarbonate transport system permease component